MIESQHTQCTHRPLEKSSTQEESSLVGRPVLRNKNEWNLSQLNTLNITRSGNPEPMHWHLNTKDKATRFTRATWNSQKYMYIEKTKLRRSPMKGSVKIHYTTAKMQRASKARRVWHSITLCEAKQAPIWETITWTEIWKWKLPDDNNGFSRR